jgi:hypothetical protein
MDARRTKAILAGLVASTSVLLLVAVVNQVQVHRLDATVNGLAADVAQLQDAVAQREAEAAWPVSPLLMDYELDVPGRGEVFPAMSEVEAPEYWPVSILRVTNTADRAVAQTVSAEIPGWSRRTERSMIVGPRETQRVMGEHVGQGQRIQLPRETLALASANCMDVSVAFASAAENIGLQPLVVIVPGHAFAGVRRERDSEDALYFDLTVLPGGSLSSAVARADSWLRKTPEKNVLVVDVAAACTVGVYPLAPRTPA